MEEEKCIGCGKIYEEHQDDYPGRPVPRMPCIGLKINFMPKKEQTTSPIPSIPVTPLTYLFSDALKLIMEGRKVTRVEWFNKEIYCLLRDTILMLHKEDGKYYQWIISEGDLVGDDWIIVPEGN